MSHQYPRSAEPPAERKLQVMLEVKAAVTRQFSRLIRQPLIQERVIKDDELFSAIISQAVTEHGVTQSALSRRIHSSVAAVSRWANGLSLPPRISRPVILQELVRMLDESPVSSKAVSEDVADNVERMVNSTR
jgi:DNA-binding transcriptional regulator YiaG